MNEKLVQDAENERLAAMKELFGSIGAVAQAGIESGQEDTPAIELPDATLDRAAAIHRIQPES